MAGAAAAAAAAVRPRQDALAREGRGAGGGRRLFTAAGCEQAAYAKPKGRPDLTAHSEGAREAAEGFNDQVGR